MFIHVNTLLICVVGAFAAGALFGAILVCCTLGCQTLLLRLTLWRRGSRVSSRETSPRSPRRSYNISPESSAPEASERLLTQNNIPPESGWSMQPNSATPNTIQESPLAANSSSSPPPSGTTVDARAGPLPNIHEAGSAGTGGNREKRGRTLRPTSFPFLRREESFLASVLKTTEL